VRWWGWQSSRDPSIEGAAPTPFLAGMAENGGAGIEVASRVGVGGGAR
jgi:hypothetical protein